MESSFAKWNLLQTAASMFRKGTCQRKKPVRLSRVGKTRRYVHNPSASTLPRSGLVQSPIYDIPCRAARRDSTTGIPLVPTIVENHSSLLFTQERLRFAANQFR